MAKRKRKPPKGDYHDIHIEARFVGNECVAAKVARPTLPYDKIKSLGNILVNLAIHIEHRHNLAQELKQAQEDIEVLKGFEQP